MELKLVEDSLRIARRYHNTKRGYLLVNALQAKHMPVSPNAAFHMMNCLGDKIAEKYPDTKLLVGFAETATAIGAAAAQRLSPDCIYVHTTRENVPDVKNWLLFEEEHSHATEQKLTADHFETWLSATDTVVFLDDEISTGKTFLNMYREIAEKFPEIQKKHVVLASLYNGVSPENEQKLSSAGIEQIYLYKIPRRNYETAVKSIPIASPSPVEPVHLHTRHQALHGTEFADPRKGIRADEYRAGCVQTGETFLAQFGGRIKAGSTILVLGTEECMYPALIIGQTLENAGKDYCVRCHATTRSPIGISSQEGYPIFSGYEIRSFYDDTRKTHIYNVDAYDAILIVSDTKQTDQTALDSLAGALLTRNGEKGIYYIQAGNEIRWTE